tara:strand:+ start:1376 stop:1714 length:339 start_codon:yes stop_codon:yes gene_type:complete
MSSLSNKDFRTILKHYKLKIPRNKKKTRKRAVNVLASKLCRCIKKVSKKKNKRTRKKYKKRASTAICTSSIFKKRGLVHSRFSCKKTPKLYINKKNKRYLSKTRKNFNMKYN